MRRNDSYVLQNFCHSSAFREEPISEAILGIGHNGLFRSRVIRECQSQRCLLRREGDCGILHIAGQRDLAIAVLRAFPFDGHRGVGKEIGIEIAQRGSIGQIECVYLTTKFIIVLIILRETQHIRNCYSFQSLIVILDKLA